MPNAPVYMLYAWTLVNIGRPQDFLPFLRPLHPGDVVAVIALLVFLMFGEKDKPVFSFPEFRIFLVLFAVSIACTPFGYYPSHSLEFIKIFYLKVGLYLYLVAKLITTEERIDGMIKTIVLSGFSMALASILMKQTGDRTFGAGGYTYDPNDLAMLMVTTLPIAIMQGLAAKKFLSRAFYLAGSAVCVIVFTYTMSRGGFLGLIGVVLFMLFTKIPQINKKLIIGFLIILSIVFIYKLDPVYSDRLRTIRADVSDIKAGSGRILVWKRGLVIFKDHPILGVGPGVFMDCYGSYIMENKFKGELSVAKAGKQWKTAHNTYLLVLTELGIFGFIAFLWLIVRVFKNLALLKRAEEGVPVKRGLQATGLQISLVGYLGCAFFLTAQTETLLYLSLILSGAMVRRMLQDQKNIALKAADSGELIGLTGR
ncbi:MAG: hypothetical protein EHM45_17480, partial [Desulfobacteraceae bacterium]